MNEANLNKFTKFCEQGCKLFEIAERHNSSLDSFAVVLRYTILENIEFCFCWCANLGIVKKKKKNSIQKPKRCKFVHSIVHCTSKYYCLLESTSVHVSYWMIFLFKVNTLINICIHSEGVYEEVCITKRAEPGSSDFKEMKAKLTGD